MIKYESMKDVELNKLAAEMCFPKSEYEHIKIYEDDGLICYYENWLEIPKADRPKREPVRGVFKPTHPDSNQIQRYLFPRLGLYITEERDTAGYYQIIIDGEDKNQDDFQIKKLDCRNKINRTIVEAVLEAWEKINV